MTLNQIPAGMAGREDPEEEKAMKTGNWYKFNDRGTEYIGQYMGRENGFECCVCGKGCKAHTFNVWYSKDGWESWGFGADHMPEIIEDLGKQDEVIIDE